MEALSTLLNGLTTAVVFMAILTVLVIVHELGHYLVAKMFGMHINAFAVMMGGVRKTDLREHLERPIARGRTVWLVALGLFGLTMLGAFMKSDPVYLVGLVSLGVGVPVWVMLRQGALYHLSSGRVIGGWLKALLIGAIVVAFGSKLQGVDAQIVVMVAIASTLISMMLNYYAPVMARDPDDDKQGQGEIEVPDDLLGKRKVGVRFRPVWFRKDKHGTEFSLLLLPLGGFAAIKGMHPKADGSEVDVEKGFYSKTAWQRWLVLFAGPLFSVVFGIIVLTTLFTTVGERVPDDRLVIAEVPQDGAAAKAGLEPGDRILKLDDTEVDSFYDLTVFLRGRWTESDDGEKVGIPILVTYERDEEIAFMSIVPTVDDKLVPVYNEDRSSSGEKAIQPVLGILLGTKLEKRGFGEAVAASVMFPIDMVTGLLGVALKPSTASENIAGPSVMIQITSSAVEQGLYYVMTLAALLSISLGVMNLLPIVPLDGGQMVVAFVEMFRGGKRLGIGVQHFLSNAGLAIIVLLMLSVFAMDIGRRAKANQSSTEENTEVSGSKSEPSEPEKAPEPP